MAELGVSVLAVGVLVVLFLVLRNRPGMGQGDGHTTADPAHDHDDAHLARWQLHDEGANDAGDHQPGGAAGSGSESGSGGGSGRDD